MKKIRKKKFRQMKIMPFIIFGLIAVIFTVLATAIFSGVYIARLNKEVKAKFGGKRWELPGRIYARPLELYSGLDLSKKDLIRELDLMEYAKVDNPDVAGSFSEKGNVVELFTRSFKFEDGEKSSRYLGIKFGGKMIESITDLENDTPVELIRLDPCLIGSFYPTHHEDRLFLSFDDTPDILIDTLLAVEDRQFYDHYGVSPSGILRALFRNLQKGGKVEGGSTLTQQLAKSFFLTHEKTYKRKINEILIAILLEFNYKKKEILQAYLNGVYLGQDGSRAIHGAAMGSLFYFGRSLKFLQPYETAMIVGLLKGPSQYDPRRFPKKAVARRNLVLDAMVSQDIIHKDAASDYKKKPLDIVKGSKRGKNRFPAFLGLVLRQLKEQYRNEDIRTEGLRIFTTFDPQVQIDCETAMVASVAKLEKKHKLPKGELQAGIIVTSTNTNDILAVIGDRNPRFQGFNRAVDAKRPIGSLVKPAIYLRALEDFKLYTLTSFIDDSKIVIEDADKDRGKWIPKNYDRKYHGRIPLYFALVHSYNASTVRLGRALGLDGVFETIKKLGMKRTLKPYMSALLGACPMAPLEVARMYQTLASGGFLSRISTIRGVYTKEGVPLKRYPLTVKQNFNPGSVFLLNKILQAVVVEGTARQLRNLLPKDLGIAGKTGTTNDLRDSWFAGFTGNRLGVVWIGRDDNKPCELTGASGALRVWAAMMKSIKIEPLELPQPENVIWTAIDPETGFKLEQTCESAIAIPFIKGSEPVEMLPCPETEILETEQEHSNKDNKDKKSKSLFMDWLKEIF
ncbi:penicillin-binding protein 1B [Desulfobacterales bacterium HSG16]|nr:penicillin-binding protein 1B [Desulfobacterales bacterium HSG16]